MRWRCGEHESPGRMRRAGGERVRRCLRYQASSRGELGQSRGGGGFWGASPGAAWYPGGGGFPDPSWICHVGVQRRGV